MTEWLGEGLLYIFLAAMVLSLFYKTTFPRNETGEVLKGSALYWLTKKLKK